MRIDASSGMGLTRLENRVVTWLTREKDSPITCGSSDKRFLLQGIASDTVGNLSVVQTFCRNRAVR